jgi:flagellar biosynthesis/type III secretory pathway chaperone
MNSAWSPIADHLRSEIAEYGGLLHLFEQQQRRLFARDAEGVLRLSDEIEAQVRLLHECRRRREDSVATFATENGHPPSVTLRSLLPLFAAEVRPLLEALINEVNLLIHRIRRVSKHNNSLLARAVETHQSVLRQLRPDAFTQTYAPNGRMTAASVRSTPVLQAAG